MVYDEEYFNSMYQRPVSWFNRRYMLGYYKSVFAGGSESRAHYLITNGLVRGGDSVLIVGAGYNWVGEALATSYGCKVTATDVSPYIQSTYRGSDSSLMRRNLLLQQVDPIAIEGIVRKYSTPAPVGYGEILPEDSGTVESRNRVLHNVGSIPDVVVIDDVLSDMEYEETLNLIRNCKAYGARITLSVSSQQQQDGARHKVL